ncbi:hypothetical protein V3C99_015339 [Haemonchus contortus]
MRGLPRSERPRPKKLVRIGTLNVGSLTGKSREVADLMKRRNIQVLCLQETRWKGAKAREIGEGVKLFYNGEDTKRNGVAVAVADSLKDSVSAVNRISSRIISVRIETKKGNWTIISEYAPQAGCPMRGLERVHGGKVRNDEGERVLTLAIAHDLAVCSTFFAKRKSQKVTYSSGGKETEIEHVLVRRSSLKTVKDIKVLPGEDLASQHRPLLADISIDLSKKSRTGTERRIRWWKLHQSEKEHLKEMILEAGLPDPEGPIQQTWSNGVEVILRCAKETLGETRGGCRGDKEAWFWNDEVQRVVRQKKSAYKRWQKTLAPEDLAATELPRGSPRPLSRRRRTRKWTPCMRNSTVGKERSSSSAWRKRVTTPLRTSG